MRLHNVKYAHASSALIIQVSSGTCAGQPGHWMGSQRLGMARGRRAVDMQGQGWRVFQCQGPKHALHQIFVIMGHITSHHTPNARMLQPCCML